MINLRLNLVLVTVFCFIWGIFALKVPVLLAFGLLLGAGLFFAGLFKRGSIDIIGGLILINIAYWLTSGFLVGSITPITMLSTGFTNGDGRGLIAWAPMLALSVVSVGIYQLDKTARIMIWVGVASILLYLFWIVTGASYLAGTAHPDEYHGLLTSHTGSGTFFGAVVTFLCLYGYEKRQRWLVLLGLLVLGPVISSASREALAGLIAMTVWYLAIRNPKPRIFVGGIVLMIVTVLALPHINQKIYDSTVGLMTFEFLDSMIDQAEVTAHSDWQPGDWNMDENSDTYIEQGDSNIMTRIILWTYAVGRFLDSPWLGMGWGRYNDRDITCFAVPYLGAFAAEGEAVLAPASAHNSYLHFASEIGLVGLLLFLPVLGMIYWRAKRAARVFSVVPEVRAYFVACQGLVIYVMACALTGHALVAPSVMVPTTTLLGVGMAYVRCNLKRPASQPTPAAAVGESA